MHLPRPPWTLPPLLWLRAGVALAAGAPLVFAFGVAWITHDDAVRAARGRLEDLAQTMEQQAERSFDGCEIVLAELARVVGRDGGRRLARRAPELNALLASVGLRLPQVRSLAVRDSQERLVAATPPHATVPPARAAYASPLRADPLTGEPYFLMSRPVAGADGRLIGSVELAIDPMHFVRHWRGLAKPERELTFRLVSADGAVLARHPGRLEPGLRLEDSAPEPEHYAAVREVGSHPVFVVARQAPAAVFAAWRRQTALLAAVTLPVTAALVYASLLALWRTRRALDFAARLQAESGQRARAEEALRHAQKMEALGELTGGVAHDFNNLMMVVSNNAHLLSRLYPQTAGSSQLAAILRALDGGTRLTRQLLAFARRQPLLAERMALEQTLPGMRDLLEATAGKGVNIAIDVRRDTPTVLVDRGELEMALINLTANARDAMNRSGQIDIVARPAVTSEAPDPARRFAVISVLDTGHGVPPELKARVFDPFFTTKPVGIGTGLGLSQVYGFCSQAGGTVQLASEPGIGTTVSMFLPAVEERVAAGARAEAQPGPSAVPALQAKVLLVEDNRDVAAALGALLSGLGCEVTPVSSVEEAEKALASAQHFDVALSDIVMPGERDGIALALSLRRRRLPVVLMTGYSRETARARAAGIDVLSKPCAPEDITRALARALASAGPAATLH